MKENLTAKKKKILYLITKSNFGGAQRYVYDLASNLPQDTFDVVVAAGGDGVLKKKLREATIRTIDLRHLGRDFSPLSDLFTFVDIIKLLKKEKPDVIHLNSSKMGFLGALAGRLHNIISPFTWYRMRILFTAHGWAFTEDRSFVTQPVIKLLQWFTILLSHTTIAVSDATKREVSGAPLISHKIKVIHNSIDAPHFKEREAARYELSEKYKIPTNAFWIGTIAELHKNKGIEYAIQALAKLRALTKTPFVYIVMGEGDNRAEIESKIIKNGLGAQVFLLGQTENAATYLKAFDTFLLPSIKEGLPYVILEALQAGIPIISSDIGGVSEIIKEDDRHILTQARDKNDTAQALARVMKNTHPGEVEKGVIPTLEIMVKETVALY